MDFASAARGARAYESAPDGATDGATDDTTDGATDDAVQLLPEVPGLTPKTRFA